MEWYVILALVLGIPIILFPVAFIWYLNVSGLYQVIRDIRQRQKRRAKAIAIKTGFTASSPSPASAATFRHYPCLESATYHLHTNTSHR